MTNELEQVTKLDEECGGVKNDSPPNGVFFLGMPEEALQSFKQAIYNQKDKEIDRLNALLAMQADAIEKIQCDPSFDTIEQGVIDATYKALNSTSADVLAWEAKKKAEIEKSVLEEVDTGISTSETLASLLYKIRSMAAERGGG